MVCGAGSAEEQEQGLQERPWRVWLAAGALLFAACTPAGGPSAAPPVATTAPAVSGPAAVVPQPAPLATVPAPEKVAAAYSEPSGAQMAILLADYAGLFRERGLEVELPLLSGDRAIQALIAGQVAFATIPGSQLVHAVAGGASIVSVAQEMDTVGMAIHAEPGIRDLRGLRGKRVGITVPGTLTDLVARVVARDAGLHVGDDVVLVPVGSVPEMVSALSVGAIDAAVLSMPSSLRARDLGFPELVDVATLGRPASIIGNMLASRRDYLDEQPDVARRFVGAYAAAVHRAREDPATAQAALMKWLQLDDPALAEAMYQAYARLLKDPPVPTVDAWRALVDVMAEVPYVNPAVRTTPPETYVDTRFVGS
jgi:ABC-type nitrate/sulfonate/bicarbonate transport system substrate-binding protein